MNSKLGSIYSHLARIRTHKRAIPAPKSLLPSWKQPRRTPFPNSTVGRGYVAYLCLQLHGSETAGNQTKPVGISVSSQRPAQPWSGGPRCGRGAGSAARSSALPPPRPARRSAPPRRGRNSRARAAALAERARALLRNFRSGRRARGTGGSCPLHGLRALPSRTAPHTGRCHS